MYESPLSKEINQQRGLKPPQSIKKRDFRENYNYKVFRNTFSIVPEQK